MIRTLALIACLAGAAQANLFGILDWNTQNVLVKFAFTLSGIGTESFIEIPVYLDNATTQGWVQYDRPASPEGLESLVLACPEDNLVLGALYDDTGFLAGLQYAMNKDLLEDPAYDWASLGYTEWDVTLTNGTSQSFWTHQLYLVSAETLATDAETRIASRDSTTILQDTDIWITDNDGELRNISTNTEYITAAGSPYTEQACIPWMGHHYYYNMSASLECSAKTISSWFPLLYSDRIIGVGHMMWAKYEGKKQYFEEPTQSDVKMIVPNGSECFYELAKTPGVLTSHIYFVNPATTITCLFED